MTTKFLVFVMLFVSALLALYESRNKISATNVVKAPSNYVIKDWEQIKRSLPFDDVRDFKESSEGLIASPPFKQIKNSKGDVVWDMGTYEWLAKGKDFHSIHPSLQRQAILNLGYGLFSVLEDKIYQIRGFDLANMTIIRGEKGWILFDVLTSVETARAALDFVNKTLGERPVSAVVFSHSHTDHYGGVRGVISDEDVRERGVKIIAPDGFLEHAVSENVYAGTAMTRRAIYQYGMALPKNEFGHVDQAIGKDTSSGMTSLMEPTVNIKEPYETHVIDGIQIEFQLTPGTEAPAEMNAWFPEWNAFWAAENITATIHNIYTLRGALIRDALVWSKFINKSLYRYGNKAKVMFSAHSWPRFGNKRIKEVMITQRDAYAHLNNTVLYHVNNGVTINEIHNVYKLPETLANKWAARSYHGSEAHNSRAVVDHYIGYWDANPSTLIPLSPKVSAPLYVEMMGGSKKILNKSAELYENGSYKEAIELLNKLVYAEPDNSVAKNMLADSFEQVGYSLESTSDRNVFLAAAADLRDGIKISKLSSVNDDVVKSMPTDMVLDYIGIKLRPGGLKGKNFKININVTDENKNYVLEASNDTLTNITGYKTRDADLTIKASKKNITDLFISDTTQKAKGISVTGNASLIKTIRSALGKFNQRFEIMPGTSKQ